MNRNYAKLEDKLLALMFWAVETRDVHDDKESSLKEFMKVYPILQSKCFHKGISWGNAIREYLQEAENKNE